MNRLVLILACAFTAGCGGIGNSPAPVDPAAYQKLTQDVVTRVATHRSNAAGAETVNACVAEHTRYDAEVRPLLERMKADSGGMDGCMMQMGKSGDADLSATCGSMMAELDGHKTHACASADAAVDKNEAARHCDAMDTWLASAKNRASYLAGSMGGMSGGGCK